MHVLDIERIECTPVHGSDLLYALIRDEQRLHASRLGIVERPVLNQNEHRLGTSGDDAEREYRSTRFAFGRAALSTTGAIAMRPSTAVAVLLFGPALSEWIILVPKASRFPVT